MGNQQKGFTLIELMMTITIIAVLLAIGIPSYQRYVIKNAEDEVKAQIGQLELQLARWRSTALTYRGFVPASGVDANGVTTYGYSSDLPSVNAVANTIIYVPAGSDRTNYRYMIELVDGVSRTTDVNGTRLGNVSLAVADGAPPNAARGRSWKIVAYPNTTRFGRNKARKFLATSQGVKCATKNPNSIQITTNDCSGNNVETW